MALGRTGEALLARLSWKHTITKQLLRRGSGAGPYWEKCAYQIKVGARRRVRLNATHTTTADHLVRVVSP